MTTSEKNIICNNLHAFIKANGAVGITRIFRAFFVTTNKGNHFFPSIQSLNNWLGREA